MTSMSKFHAAENLLLDSLHLYASGRLVSATSLAGAAEEIFSKLLNARGEKNSLDSAHLTENSILASVNSKSISKKKTAKNLFRLRNNLKHIDVKQKGNAVLQFKIVPDVHSQILRALHDYEKLKTKRIIPFELQQAIKLFRLAYRHTNLR